MRCPARRGLGAAWRLLCFLDGSAGAPLRSLRCCLARRWLVVAPLRLSSLCSRGSWWRLLSCCGLCCALRLASLSLAGARLLLRRRRGSRCGAGSPRGAVSCDAAAGYLAVIIAAARLGAALCAGAAPLGCALVLGGCSCAAPLGCAAAAFNGSRRAAAALLISAAAARAARWLRATMAWAAGIGAARLSARTARGRSY